MVDDLTTAPSTKELVATIVASYVKKNSIAAADLPTLITTLHQSLRSLGGPIAPATGTLIPAVSIRRSVQNNAVICLECGWSGQMLRRHLTTAHHTSPEQYRARWNLPNTHPLTAPSYTSRRSELAKQFGLGRHREA